MPGLPLSTFQRSEASPVRASAVRLLALIMMHYFTRLDCKRELLLYAVGNIEKGTYRSFWFKQYSQVVLVFHVLFSRGGGVGGG